MTNAARCLYGQHLFSIQQKHAWASNYQTAQVYTISFSMHVTMPVHTHVYGHDFPSDIPHMSIWYRHDIPSDTCKSTHVYTMLLMPIPVTHRQVLHRLRTHSLDTQGRFMYTGGLLHLHWRHGNKNHLCKYTVNTGVFHSETACVNRFTQAVFSLGPQILH